MFCDRPLCVVERYHGTDRDSDLEAGNLLRVEAQAAAQGGHGVLGGGVRTHGVGRHAEDLMPGEAAKGDRRMS